MGRKNRRYKVEILLENGDWVTLRPFTKDIYCPQRWKNGLTKPEALLFRHELVHPVTGYGPPYTEIVDKAQIYGYGLDPKTVRIVPWVS